MPLSINVGLSRKASRNYQSTGVSINVTAELDQSLLAKPQELHQQIGDLYAQAQAALEGQVQNMGHTGAPLHQNGNAGRGNGNDRANGNGNGDRHYTNGNGNGRRINGNGNANGNTATDSQRRAIAAIARRLNLDPDYEAEQILGIPLDNLSLRDASELIDHLKSLQATGGRTTR